MKKYIAPRITVDPEQCGGRPCVRGMRIRVTDVLDLLADGLTPDQALEDLPDLEIEDITACLKFASKYRKEDSVATKYDLHKIVDELTDLNVDAATQYLTYLRDFADPAVADPDDEPDDYSRLSPEVIGDIEESLEDIRQGRTIPLEDFRKELSL